MCRPDLVIATVLLAAGAAVQPADAALFYEFTFTGEVIQAFGDNPDHPWGGLDVGDDVFFSYVIDVEQDDAAASAFFGLYEVTNVRLGFGGVIFDVPGADQLTVSLDGIAGADQAEIQYENNVVPGYPNDGGAFQLRGFSVFEDDSIPIDFELEDFILAHGAGYGGGIEGGVGFISEFTDYSYRIVPGPAAFLLLPGLLFSRRRRDR